MERVAFLVEDTGEQLSCLLNPESLVLRREAGVKRRELAGGLAAGTTLADDPLLLTGGGCTELTLNLLFDVTLPGSSITTEDVRELTGPLWRLTENSHLSDGFGRPPVARFIWGKSWNLPGIVTAVAERLEYFTPAGVARRSWLRLRMLRVSEPPPTAPARRPPPPDRGPTEVPGRLQPGASEAVVHEVRGAVAATGAGGCLSERLDQLAHRYYGDAALWRLLASVNGIDDPACIPAGSRLEVPPVSRLGGER